VFVRYEEPTGRSYRVFYDDNNPNRVLREERAAPGEAEQAPKDGLMGDGFAEGALTRLLTDAAFLQRNAGKQVTHSWLSGEPRP
jgi:hypothetical protein